MNMKILSHRYSLTEEFLVKKERVWSKEKPSAAKSLKMRGAFFGLAIPLNLADMGRNIIAVQIKLVCLAGKYSLGQFFKKNEKKWAESFPDWVGVKELLWSMAKTVLFAVSFFASPFIGLISPNFGIRYLEKSSLVFKAEKKSQKPPEKEPQGSTPTLQKRPDPEPTKNVQKKTPSTPTQQEQHPKPLKQEPTKKRTPIPQPRVTPPTPSVKKTTPPAPPKKAAPPTSPPKKKDLPTTPKATHPTSSVKKTTPPAPHKKAASPTSPAKKKTPPPQPKATPPTPSVKKTTPPAPLKKAAPPKPKTKSSPSRVKKNVTPAKTPKWMEEIPVSKYDQKLQAFLIEWNQAIFRQKTPFQFPEKIASLKKINKKSPTIQFIKKNKVNDFSRIIDINDKKIKKANEFLKEVQLLCPQSLLIVNEKSFNHSFRRGIIFASQKITENITTEGIFRLAGNRATQGRFLKAIFERKVKPTDFVGVHDCCDLIKALCLQYNVLRENNIIKNEHLSKYKSSFNKIKELMNLVVQNSVENRMDKENLELVAKDIIKAMKTCIDTKFALKEVSLDLFTKK